MRDQWLVTALEAAGCPWTAVTWVPQTGSTNADLAAAARGGAPEGSVIVADHQSAGRGRLDRTWVSEPGEALLFSVLLRPDEVATLRWPWLSHLAGVSVVGGLAMAGVTARLKWPNDVLIGDAKVAGILSERVEGAPAAGPGDAAGPGTEGDAAGSGTDGDAEDGGAAAVVGIGVNVAAGAPGLPPGATSLESALGAPPPDRAALLAAILVAFHGWYERWVRAAGDAVECGLHAAYGDVCATLGREVVVELPGRAILNGKAVGIDSSGCLAIATTGGQVSVAVGDVVHVRSTD